ncbi:MAG: transcriptional regulator [Bauldia sp.]|nr:transcriptional regulator [Bauldia sp.]
MNRREKIGLFRRAAMVALLSAAAVGCQLSDVPKHLLPIPGMLVAKMRMIGVEIGSPIYVRIFKEESEVEIWKQTPNGSYALLTTYDICRWSGVLGPKIREGDRQAPEGFYTVTPAQMNPNSIAYLAFNIGYPNAFDRSLGRTGSNLMVHGACSSSGCYALTDEDAGEVFAIAREAFEGGQRAFQVHAFPFRMTAANMARHADSEHAEFWWMLKEGYDSFEATRTVPGVNVCDRRYVFNADAGGARFDANAVCPPYSVPEPTRTLVAQRSAAERLTYQNLIARMGGRAEPPPPPAIASALPPATTPAPGASGPFVVGAAPTPAPSAGAAPMPLSRPEVVAATAPVPPAPAPIAASTAVPTVSVEAPVTPAASSYYESLFTSGIWSATTSTVPPP